MRKNFKDFLIAFILILFTLYIIINPFVLIKSVNYSMELFIYNIFPTLFPFFILSEFLTNYKITYLIGKFLKKGFGYLFKINEEECFAFVLSIFSGQPSNAKYIKDLLDNKKITRNNATNMLCYSFFPSPMFILGTIGTLFYENLKVGVAILFITYFTNIIMGIKFRNKNDQIEVKYKRSKVLPFGKLMNKSILNAFNILFLILGSMTIFVIVTNILIYIFDLDFQIECFIASVLEITQGTKKISLLNIDTNLKIIFSCIALSFGGLSIHSQVMSILYNYKLNYKKVILNRLLAAGISIIMSFIIIFIFKL